LGGSRVDAPRLVYEAQVQTVCVLLDALEASIFVRSEHRPDRFRAGANQAGNVAVVVPELLCLGDPLEGGVDRVLVWCRHGVSRD
jgi:hypothetical protein